ncbi:hypothetical protein P7H60_06450 [Vagococcus carniphilus]|uniref:hypothetical protein n=1 Tax=Vagococcus carniphilus TaxID=218144 RepID=UPI00288F0C47|nr:hypothetical protein [Vagococcus carniphilus]MDT2848797.1 hypothetical protein [Vagococcus carniphilus]
MKTIVNELITNLSEETKKYEELKDGIVEELFQELICECNGKTVNETWEILKRNLNDVDENVLTEPMKDHLQKSLIEKFNKMIDGQKVEIKKLEV